MRTAQITKTNAKAIVVKVSEIEFQAALAAYQDNMNAECPGEYDFDETLELTNAYYGIGTVKATAAAAIIAPRKPTVMNRVKAFFA